MTDKIIIPNFGFGEVSPAFRGQIGSEVYRSGLATAKNVIISEEGGVYNRAGTKFIAPIRDHDKGARLIPIFFSSTDVFVLEFGDRYIRFIRGEQHIRNAPVSVTSVSPGASGNLRLSVAVTYVSNINDDIYPSGFEGTLSVLNDRYWRVIDSGVGWFEIGDQVTHSPVLAAGQGVGASITLAGATIERIYQLPSPYRFNDIDGIRYAFNRGTMTLVHGAYSARELERITNEEWTLTVLNFVAQPSEEDVVNTLDDNLNPLRPTLELEHQSRVINENEQAVFNLKLGSSPSSDVIVTATADDPTRARVDQTTRTYTSNNWSAYQQFGITSLSDPDREDQTIAVTFQADGGSNNRITAAMIITDTTNPNPTLVVDPLRLNLREGGTDGQVDVSLSGVPPNPVSVALTLTAGVEGKVNVSVDNLEFTDGVNSNWNVVQSITFSPQQDNDREDSRSEYLLQASGGADHQVHLIVDVEDTTEANANLTVDTLRVDLTEGGGSGRVGVKLTNYPDTMVQVRLTGGNTSKATVDLTIIEFTAGDTGNWNVYQYITFSPVQDSDNRNETLSYTLTATGGSSSTLGIVVAVDDDETSVTTYSTGYVYRRSSSTPSTPTGGTSNRYHIPFNWQSNRPTATTTQGVYRASRTLRYQDGSFVSAGNWGGVTRVTAPIPAPVVVTNQTGYVYRRGSSTPSTPTGGTTNQYHVPFNWSSSQPAATTTQGVYRASRTLRFEDGTFVSATNWGGVTRVTAPVTVVTNQSDYVYRRGSSTPSTPTGGTTNQDHVPSDWSSSQPTATTTQGVYRASRTLRFEDGTFVSAGSWGSVTRVTAPLPTPVVVTNEPDYVYRRGSSTPSTPTGGTTNQDHVPSGWSSSQPAATTTQGVYRASRTLRFEDGTFVSATNWGGVTRVTEPLPPVEVSPGSPSSVNFTRTSSSTKGGTLYGFSFSWSAPSDWGTGTTRRYDVDAPPGTRLLSNTSSTSTSQGFETTGPSSGRVRARTEDGTSDWVTDS